MASVVSAAGKFARRVGGGLRRLMPWAAVVTVVTTAALGILAWTGSQEARGTTSAGAEESVPPDATASAEPSGRDEPTDPSGRDEPTDPSGRDEPTDPRSVADAPRTDPVGLVRALADARAAAWSTGVVAQLAGVDAPRSPAMARDTEALARVQQSKQRYVGLTFAVRSARVVGARDGVVSIHTRIDTGAHVVRGPSGDVQRPATAKAPVLLDVVHTEFGWRVHDVRAV